MIYAKQKKQKGALSLPMIAVALGVAALFSIGLARKQIVAVEVAAGETAGYSLNQVAQAVYNYRGSNLNALTAASPTVSGFANAMSPTIAELKTAGYLNPAVANTLPDGNAYRITIAKMPVGCVGPAATCNVWSMLSLTNPIVDINTGKPSITRLGSLTASIQDSASFSVAPTPSKIVGGGGAWTVDNPDASNRAGIVVVVSGLGGTGTQWLRVGDPRDPAFTGDATVAGYIKPSAGPGQTVTAGAACGTAPSGAIKNDATGRLLTCQNGIWTATDGSKASITQVPVSNVPGGTNFTVGTCAAGGTPWATYTAQLSAVNDTVIPPYQGLVYSVSQVGGNWVTLTQANRPGQSPVAVNASNYASILGSLPIGVFTAGCSYS